LYKRKNIYEISPIILLLVTTLPSQTISCYPSDSISDD